MSATALARAMAPATVCLALAVFSTQTVAALAIGVVALTSAVVPWRMTLDRASQRIALLVALVLVIATIRTSQIPLRGPGLGAFGVGFAVAPLVMTTFRLYVESPEGGRRLDLALALVGLLAVGGARPGVAYVGFVIAFIAALVLRHRAEDPDRRAFSGVSPRTRRWGLALVGITILTGTGIVLVAQLTYARMQQRFQRSFEMMDDESGLSDTVRLGAMRGLLLSDQIVLRVSGAETDRLRGVVLDEYGAGRWTRAKPEVPTPFDVPREPPVGRDVVEVRHVTMDDGDQLVAPLHARDIATSHGVLLADSAGLLHAPVGDRSPVVWFRDGDRNAFPVAVPRTSDLLVPRRIRGAIAQLAASWTEGARTPEEALAAIDAHLERDYTYSLGPQPISSVDPILEFLQYSKRGHCEYFASAFALLARTLGIPARVVLGYRVGEKNPYWGHYVVRKRNAHAWVEVSPPRANGAWVTIDPTPTTELPQDRRHEEVGSAALAEAVGMALDRAEAWLAARSALELSIFAVVAAALFAFQRWWRNRVPPAADDDPGFRPAAPAFVRLERALAARGLGRKKGEAIEDWAHRVARPDVSRAVGHYASARYGDAESAGPAAELDAVARDIHRARSVARE